MLFIFINILQYLLLFGQVVVGFNIYEEQLDIFTGVNGSLFGYTVLQHENSQGKW